MIRHALSCVLTLLVLMPAGVCPCAAAPTTAPAGHTHASPGGVAHLHPGDHPGPGPSPCSCPDRAPHGPTCPDGPACSCEPAAPALLPDVEVAAADPAVESVPAWFPRPVAARPAPRVAEHVPAPPLRISLCSLQI